MRNCPKKYITFLLRKGISCETIDINLYKDNYELNLKNKSIESDI